MAGRIAGWTELTSKQAQRVKVEGQLVTALAAATTYEDELKAIDARIQALESGTAQANPTGRNARRAAAAERIRAERQAAQTAQV